MTTLIGQKKLKVHDFLIRSGMSDIIKADLPSVFGCQWAALYFDNDEDNDFEEEARFISFQAQLGLPRRVAVVMTDYAVGDGCYGACRGRYLSFHGTQDFPSPEDFDVVFLVAGFCTVAPNIDIRWTLGHELGHFAVALRPDIEQLDILQIEHLCDLIAIDYIGGDVLQGIRCLSRIDSHALSLMRTQGVANVKTTRDQFGQVRIADWRNPATEDRVRLACEHFKVDPLDVFSKNRIEQNG